MRTFSRFVFLTLVGSVLHAGAVPSVNAPKPGLPSETESRDKQDPEKAATTRWTPPPTLPPSEEIVVSSPPREHARSPYDVGVRAGVLGGQLLEPSEFETTTLLGATLSWEREVDEIWDFGLDLSATNLVRIGAARRFSLESSRLIDAPYWSAGVTQTLQASRLLASLVDLQRVKFMVNFGFADLFEQDGQWRAEAGVGYGIAGAVYNIQGGWVYHW